MIQFNEEKLREARILMNGPDPKQKERARELCLQVIQEAEGTELANEARDFLAKSEPPQRDPINPRLEALLTKWAGIQGFEDHRLPEFIDKLEELEPGLARGMRSEIVKSLRRWIEDTLPKVTHELSEREEKILNGFVQVASKVHAYLNVPGFEELCSALFRIKFQKTQDQIDKMLKVWQTREASTVLTQLVPTPEFQNKLSLIQTRIDDITEKKMLIERLLNDCTNTPSSDGLKTWGDIRIHAGRIQKLQFYLSDKSIPPEWQNRLNQANSSGIEAIRLFLERQSLEVETIEAARSFWTEFQRVPTSCQLTGNWFQHAADKIRATLQNELDLMTDYKEVRKIIADLRDKMTDLPRELGKDLLQFVNEANEIENAWRAMVHGEKFEFNRGTQYLNPPNAFRELLPVHQSWNTQLSSQFIHFKDGKAVPDEILIKSSEISEIILRKMPLHQFALKLKQRVEQHLIRNKLDEALSNWNIGEFFKGLPVDKQLVDDYQLLLDHKDELSSLAELSKQDAFSTWAEALQWWKEWRDLIRQLPHHKPESLDQAIVKQEYDRCEQWYQVLGGLVQTSNLSPEELDNIALSIESEHNNETLQEFCRDFKYKATIAWASHYITQKNFVQAREYLDKMRVNDPEAVRLQTLFKIERANNGLELTEVLWNYWTNILHHIDQPYPILMKALQEVWELDNREALEKLRKLLQRVLNNPKHPLSQEVKQLEEWENWLKIEETLLTESNLHSVKQLSLAINSNLDLPSQIWVKRLKKLQINWEKQQNLVMLSWAFQAFQRIDPNIGDFSDPVKSLQDQSIQLADQVFEELTTNPDLDIPALETWASKLADEENKWYQLEDMLDLLAFQVIRPQKPGRLLDAIELVKKVLRVCAELEELRKIDLRKGINQYSTVEFLINQLQKVAIHNTLKQRLELLEPLSKLYFLEQRILESAEKCGSESPIIIYELGHFSKLANWVAQVAEKFHQAQSDTGFMWDIVSKEYCETIFTQACLFIPKINPPSLSSLVKQLEQLQQEENRFKQVIEDLENQETQPSVSPGGSFDPEQHRGYLELIPKYPPRSRKTYLRFDRCAKREPIWTTLNKSRPYLPQWVINYLDEGVPQCENKF